MELIHLAYLLTAATGLCAAGVVGSLWTAVRGEAPSFELLLQPHPLLALSVLAVVFHAPLGFIRSGLWHVVARPAQGSVLIAAGLGWSFLQGVFILTQFFGFT
jgi:hypothetical protein